ncbi:uncharacterized protein BO80DRAFT_14409 [Aspergillus ibericus CBS 121593]|uniref:Protein kinase domain-containing protein n=1 Tax=Aspergillus ibericus CBS 121593 TaxID=1448316 RepID=A0A395H8E6_9EURO|nr:hypothetical protein BO80DRAFT_14409 [Aspergillus ibericus CBS 121593]RAL03148.1 hypothetical protein BO80DRAFT_14409 [Aspergillus ibericus CBS 121593]
MADPFTDDYNTLHNIPKPALPYIPGFEFTITEHTPPNHRVIKKYLLTREEAFQRENTDVLTRCFNKSPLPGHTGSHTLRLKIRKQIRVSDGKSSQIVLVEVISNQLPETMPTTLVAKLYDPLYWDHYQDSVDPFIYIDKEYATETAAYQHLHRQLHEHGETTTHIPHFYGSYTTDITHPDTTPPRNRPVRLILLEHISGLPMDTLNPHTLSQATRKIILEQIITVESHIYKLGVDHFDTYPRNILIQHHPHPSPSSPPSPSPEKNIQITLLDFGHAKIGRSPNPEIIPESDFLGGTYISPILRWTTNGRREPMDSYHEWVDWDWNDWIFEVYGADVGGITEEMYQWLPYTMEEMIVGRLGKGRV